MNQLTLGVPSKGRLQSDTIAWFEGRGVTIRPSARDREYRADVDGVDGIAVVLLSAGEIPHELADGRLHIGITGEDLIRERVAFRGRRVDLAARMGFGHADLIVAVPDFWIDVETMADLDEVCADFRARHGRALRIATKYHNLTRSFFRKAGVADYRIVDSQGATEAAPKNRTAEAVVDITSTGATLRANHLRVLADGLILRSEANLCVSREAEWTDETRAAYARLVTQLGLASEPERRSADDGPHM